MSSKTRTFFLSLTIIAILFFSAVGTTTVYADDGTTTVTRTTDTSGGGSTDESTTDPQPAATVEPVATEESATTDTTGGGSTDSEPAATVEPVATEVSTVDTTVTDTTILERVPENTTVAVLNADGQPQPLATPESADAIAVTSDPIWCPSTQTTPTPGANGCTTTFTSFDLLLTELAGNAAYQGDGIIYVQQGAYNGGESTIDFNSYNLSNISNSALTLQGGWNTSNNTVELTTTSDFNIPILIGSSANPWGGSLTINNIVVNNSNATGLTVYSQGDVNIESSRFERNREAGAIIRAGGDVNVSNSSFSNPGTNRTQRTGLDIISEGSGGVSLFDVLANGNREVGANIVANGRVTIGSSFVGGSSFSGMKSTTTTTCPGSPSQFCGFGLQVTTPDSIDLQGVVGNDNFLWGANLMAGQDVNIIDSIFNANSTEVPTFIDDTGLLVTAGGDVALNNVTANDNRLYGAIIDAVGNVSIDNSTFNGNNGVTVSGGVSTFHGVGLQITSDADIFVNNVDASGNTLAGASLDAAGLVIVGDSFFNNNTTGSATDALGVGLKVISDQEVFIDNVTLDGNQLFGASIQTPGDVFIGLLGPVTATNNGTNGVEVDANCTNLNGGTFTGNGEYGLSLVNPALNLTGSPVFSGNGLGDIFPANPGPCPVVSSGGGTGGTGSGNGSTSGGTSGTSTSGQSQSVSLVTINVNSGDTLYKGLGLINSGAITLENLFANGYQLIGVSTSLSGDVTTLGIFTGKYAYIHSANGLQIVLLLQPTIFSNVWSSNQS